MSRKSTIEPRWLVSMLTAWARHCVAQMDKGLGYPNRSILLSEWSARSRGESTSGVSLGAYDKDDFEQIEAAMKSLALASQELFAAITMYYKPWTINGMKEQGHPFGTRNYYYRLHAAHRMLASMLIEIEQKYHKLKKETVDV